MFQVSIADIALGVDLRESPAGITSYWSRLKMESEYNKFFVPQRGDTAFFFRLTGSLPERNYKGCFKSEALWVLHFNSRKDFRIEFSKGQGGPALAFLDLDLKEREGTVFYTEEGLKIPETGPLPFSHPVDGVIFINLLPSCNGLLLHACGINDHCQGFIFPGRSGDGKSTTARLWDGEPGVDVLSDERTIIRESGNKFFIYGTPWHGEVAACSPGKTDLKKIFFLQHARQNYAKAITVRDAAAKMFVRCLPTFWDREGLELSLSLIQKIVQNVPCYELGFVPDKSAVRFVRSIK